MTVALPENPELRIAARTDVVWSRGPARLLRYHSDRRTHARPVVMVPSILNRAYVLDLREGQSVADFLLGEGHDVYLLDWGRPSRLDANLDLAAYTLDLLPAAIRAARRTSGADACHLLGYCLGGTFALIAAARQAAPIASVIALTTPVDLSEPGPVGRLTDPALLDVERLARAFPVVPGPMLWTAFQSLDPVGIGTKWRGFAERSDDEAFVERFLAQESWLADPVPMTAAALRDIVHGLYRDNALAEGKLKLKGSAVDLGHGVAPVLNLIAQWDSIVPGPAAQALDGLWGGPVETHVLRGGHIGVTVGSKAPQNMWKLTGEWLERDHA